MAANDRAMVEAAKWKLEGFRSPIADTGDYDSHYEITDGNVTLFSEDCDFEALQQVTDALNEGEVELYLDDSREFVLFHEKQELERQLKDAISQSALAVAAERTRVAADNEKLREALQAIKHITDGHGGCDKHEPLCSSCEAHRLAKQALDTAERATDED